ncbi:deoxycytidylate deaminase-like [Symphorus nematophorus]
MAAGLSCQLKRRGLSLEATVGVIKPAVRPRDFILLPGDVVFIQHTGESPEQRRSNTSNIHKTMADLNRKREDYLDQSVYFMAVALLAAQRSRDPSSQVGACIVNQENKIVGIGYNCMPNGCDDDQLPWARSADNRLDTKYPYVCHAELNAIMNKNSADVKGCTMYVTLFPCNECAKLIIQAGIKEVVYLSDKYHDTPEVSASRRLLDMAGVQYRQFKPKKPELVIDFNSIDRSRKPRKRKRLTLESC